MGETINNVLNSSDMPNLYKNEDTNIDILWLTFSLVSIVHLRGGFNC